MSAIALKPATVSIAAALSLAVAGCSMMNPYDHVAVNVGGQKNLQLAGFANEALASADAMRQQYYDNLRYTSYVRNGAAIGASVLTGWALYNALKFNGTDAVATAGDTRRGVQLGVSLGALYGLRQIFVNPEQESIYAEGYRALTCLMLQSAPLLMTEAIPPSDEKGKAQAELAAASAAAAPRSSVGTPWTSDLPPLFTQPSFGDLDRLQAALDRLEARILELNIQVSAEESQLEERAVDDKTVIAAQNWQRDQVHDAKTALTYARNALTDGRYLVRVIKGAGRDIQTRVGIIMATVNEQVQGHQRNFREAADVLKDAHNITSGILGVGSDTATDQTTANAAALMSSIPNPSRDGVMLAGPMSAAGSAFASFGGAVEPALAASAVGPGAKRRKKQSAPPQASSSPASAAIVVTPESLFSQRATAAELTVIRDGINLVLKRIAADQAKADKDAAEAAFKKEIAAHEATIKRLGAKAIDTPKGMSALGEQIERLYALRRPVVQELLNFRRKVRATMETPECAELAALRVMPNDVARALPGDTVSYIIRQRIAGVPVAVFQGPTDADKGITFNVVALPGTSPSIYEARLKVGKDMALQTVRLIVSDSKGNATQTIRIVAGKKKSDGDKPKPPDAAASAASPVSAATGSTS